MRHLGSFGAAVKEADPNAERDTFDFFGEKFTVHGIIPPVLMLQLGAAASGKIEESEGYAAMWEALRCSLTQPEREEADELGELKKIPEDGSQFDRFYKLAVSKRDDIEDLMKLAFALFEAQAGRPTGEQSTSSVGPLTTSPSSNASSSTRPALPGYTRIADITG